MKALLLSLLLLAALRPALAQETPAPPPPAVAEGSVVGEIRIVTNSIFDPDKPGEDRLLFRLADRLHRTTRPQVIERQLLLKRGDRYTPEALQESERILRANPYLYDAQVRAVPAGDGVVDIEVVTRDVWTLQGGISFNRAGGKNTSSIHLEDYNFLGTGKEITLLHISDVDRDSDVFRYRDPNLRGSHGRLELSWADNSDGGRERFELERPFYSLDTRWATGLRTMRDERVEPLYEFARVVNRFRHETDFAEVYAGLSPGLADRSTHRFKLGYTFDRERFDAEGGTDSTTVIPPDRELSYPWIGFEYVQDGFVTERGLDRLQRAQDLNLGKQFHARLGWSTPALGGDITRLLFETGATTGWRPSPRQLLLAAAQGSTRTRSGQAENLRVGGSLRYYARNFRENVFYAAAEGEFGRRLDPETQILLGGDNGLRGYPLRLQSGDRRFLVTLEQRFFSDRELFHLVHLGAAVFFDAGRAWYDKIPDRYFFPTERPVLKDVGLGLRIGSSRSSKASMIHLDLAYPLDGDRKKVQWLVSSSESF
jgi:outer membrane protein assembly factor BamA